MAETATTSVKRRKGAAVLIATSVLLAVAASVWFGRLPIINSVLEAEPQRRGFSDARVQLIELTWTTAKLNPVQLGPDIGASEIEARFDPMDIWASRFDRAEIAVTGLAIDFSDPAAGALRALQSMGGGGPSEPITELPPLPKVSITKAHIFGQAGTARPDIRFDAQFMPGAEGAEILIDGIAIKDDQPSPQFYPIQVDASGHLRGSKLSIDTAIKLAQGKVVVDTNFHHDLGTNAGTLSLHSPLVDFDGNHLSPSMISALASVADAITAKVRLSGILQWSHNQMDGHLQAAVTDAAVDRNGIKMTEGGIDAAVFVSVPHRQILLSADDAKAQIIAQGREVHVSDVFASLTLDDWAETANGALRSARLAGPDFAPLSITGEVFADASKKIFTSLKASVLNDAVNLSVDARHDVNAQTGDADISLSPIIFSENLQPRHLSPLAEIPGVLSGTLGGSAQLRWTPESQALDATAKITRLGFENQSIHLRDITGDIKATSNDITGTLTTNAELGGTEISADGREFALGPIRLNGQWQDNQFSAETRVERIRHIGLPPLFRPLTLDLDANGTLEEIEFEAALSQEKGAKLELNGNYEINTSSLRTDIRIPSLVLSDAGLTPAGISPLLDIADSVSGAFAASSVIRLRDGNVSGSGDLVLDNLTLSKGDLLVEGLSGRLQAAEIHPLKTKGIQHLAAQRVFAGLEISNPSIDYAVDESPLGPLPRLNLHAASIGVAGGTISIASAEIDPNRERQEVALDFDNVDLG